MAEENKAVEATEEVKEVKVKEFSLDDLLNPTLSRVAKTTDGLVITTYGYGGLGKTPVAAKMEKPYYLAFGKSGVSGLNNVPIKPIMSWADFKKFVKTFCDPKNFDTIHERFQTLILDELEVLYKYCETYVANSEGVNKIKQGNGGFGLWKDLKDEWETEILKVIGSGFCVMFILHTSPDENGRQFPVGDAKRMLPILINHSDIVGYVIGNGVSSETGKAIHSSLGLAATNEYFARTRNEYFDPIIEDYTAENLVKAYFDAIERQEKAEGVVAITKEERDKMFEVKKRSFKDVMNDVQETGAAVIEKYGSKEKLTEIVEDVLGPGALVSSCTAKQQEAVEVILDRLKDLLDE